MAANVNEHETGDLLLHRSTPSQENHEAGFPAASMPERPSLAHNALGTGTDCGTKLRGRLYGWFESTNC